METRTVNPIIYELNAIANTAWSNPKQQAFFEQQAKDAKAVDVVPVKDVFTDAEIQLIKTVIEPKQGKCYRNAALLSELFPDRCKYVEGYGWHKFIKIEHAFNRVGDKYVDITWELALGEDVAKMYYASLIEATSDEVISDIEAHGNTTGDYYLHNYIKNHIN